MTGAERRGWKNQDSFICSREPVSASPEIKWLHRRVDNRKNCPTSQATHSGSLGAGAAHSSLHLHRPLCGAGASMGPSGLPGLPRLVGRLAPCSGVAGSLEGQH